MSFSQRKGLKPIKKAFQIDSMDDDLRNKLWNIVSEHLQLGRLLQTPFWRENPEVSGTIKKLWHNYFKKPLDTIPDYGNSIAQAIRSYFFGCKWNEVYDFIEFITNEFPRYEDLGEYNVVLEQEVSGYRLINGQFSEITTEEEIQEIEEAINKNSSATEHLKTALKFLSDRKSPDYRNSIKESISAVEAACRLLAENEKATLGDALKQVSEKYPIHPALKEAFSKIYGYTNDTDGIRHAMMNEPTVKFEDAKFMLVSCSAFVNYLRVKGEGNFDD